MFASDASLGSTTTLRSLTAILILLVMSTRADDTIAAYTPDPDDDILATQNNNYRPAIRAVRGRPVVEEEMPFLNGLDAQTSGCSAVAPTIVGLPYPQQSPWSGADLLYSFMSLQC